MNPRRTFLLILMCLCFVTTIKAQQTSIDLRRDGRIITDSRKDYFLSKVKALQIRLDDNLRVKLGNTRVSAILVPSTKIDDKYLIGVVIGTNTLPDDWVVNEQDFGSIRAYSTNQKLSAIEAKYSQIKATVNLGIDAGNITAELRLIIGEKQNEDADAASYAGYLLQALGSNIQTARVSDLVDKYRAEQARAIDQMLGRYADLGPAWTYAFRLGESEDTFKINDLVDALVERQPASASRRSYLRVWKGRDVLIVPEEPDTPYDAAKYKGIVDYLKATNSPSVEMIFRPRLVPQ